MKKAVIFAPFWRYPGHVGNNRLERFVRWLFQDGFHVVIIRAGAQDEYNATPWGVELTIRDSLGLYRESRASDVAPLPRKPNKFRRAVAYWLFNPDPSVVWAKAAATHPSVEKTAKDACLILSSSPPESSHVGAWLLALKLNCPHIVDMRDGWLDEPLKPILVNSALRRWQEGRLEAKILSNAARIFVTSDVWRDLLCQRMPAVADKTVVLTNGYPNELACNETVANSMPMKNDLILIHAGRFSGSDPRRTPDILLEPLLNIIQQRKTLGVVRLIGPLSAEELAVIAKYQAQFAQVGWSIECLGSMPRDQLLQELKIANGLLLLSASYAAIPSKLFEYIPTGRPILVVTERNSATWRICEGLPQACLVDFHLSEKVEKSFISIYNMHDNHYKIPDQFSEIILSKTFLMSIFKK